MQALFNLFQFMTDISYNIWPWLLLVITPVLIFSAKPHHTASWRFLRIFLCVAMGYVLINLAYNTNYHIGWKDYEVCQSQFPDGSIQQHPECGKPPRGIPLAFMSVMGWIPAASYAGFWEFWWRRKYAFIIHPLGKRYKGRWFSTTLIVCSVPVIFSAFIIFILYIYTRIDCPPAIIKRGACWIPLDQ